MVKKVIIVIGAFLTLSSLIYPAFSQRNDGSNGFGGAIPFYPFDSKHYDVRGTFNATNYDFDAAISNFDRAIQLNSNDVVAYESRGCCYVLKGDADKAIDDFTQAIRLNPTNAQAYLNRASAYRMKPDLDKALRDLGACLQLDPKNALAYKTRAIVYGSKGEIEPEIADWNSELKLAPDDASALASRGYAYFKTGRFDKAVDDYRRAIQVDPQSEVAYNNLAGLRATCPDVKMRNGKEAVDAATKACTLANWHESNWVDTLAAAYAEDGDFEHAIEYQKEAISMSGETGKSLTEMQNRLSLYEQNRPDHDGQDQ